MTLESVPQPRIPYLPGPVGRVVRLLLGVALANLVLSLVDLMVDGFSGWPEGGGADVFVGIVITVWLAPTVWDIGLGSALGHGWHGVAAGGAALAAAGWAAFGSPGTGAAYWLLTWISVTLGWLAVSFVLAALLRTPGCEMRAFRHVLSRLVGDDDGFVACPGPLQPLDEWEARATGMARPYPEHSDM